MKTTLLIHFCFVIFVNALQETEKPIPWSLRVHPNHDISLLFTQDEAENALLMMQKIESLCIEHDEVMHELAVSTLVTYCIDFVRRQYSDIFMSGVPSIPQLNSHAHIGAVSTMHHMGSYEMRFGAYDFLYFNDAQRPVRLSSEYIWRTSVALLVPLRCDTKIKSVDDMALLNMLLPSIKDTLRGETDYWASVFLLVALPSDCLLADGTPLDGPTLEAHISLLGIPFSGVLVLVSAWSSMSTQYDSLLATAHSHDIDYFMLLQEHLLFTMSNWLWNGVIMLTRAKVLPGGEGLGCVLLHSNKACTDPSGAACPTGLVLARSHVDIFLPDGAFSSLSGNSLSAYATMMQIVEIYAPFELAYFDMVYLHSISETYPYKPVPEDITTLHGTYPMDVFTARHQVAAWLYNNSPFSPSLKYADADLLYGKNDMFFDMFVAEGHILAGSDNGNQNGGKYKQESASEIPQAEVAVITGIFGGYEAVLKRFAKQSVPTDFICFTDMQSEIDSRGWIIDRNPYHLHLANSIDTGNFVNSIKNNMHPMNIGKFYKQYFFAIPRMKKYTTVIWADGNLQLEHPHMVAMMQSIISGGNNIILFEHWRYGKLKKEVEIASISYKYNSTVFNGIVQPLQDIPAQYEAYMLAGYDDDLYWKRARPDRPQYGLWITSFIAYDMTDPDTQAFLSNWYMQTLSFSTQDQVGFSFAAQMSGVLPYSLPDRVNVNGTAIVNTLYTKSEHGSK